MVGPRRSPPDRPRAQPAPPPDRLIPDREIELRTARSGGPGGQHVNKTETKVEARWNAHAASALDAAQRARILAALAGRLDADGTLRVTASGTRSQAVNREEAVRRLRAIVAKALEPRKKRRPTKPTAASKTRRIEAKKKRGETKRWRRPISGS